MNIQKLRTKYGLPAKPFWSGFMSLFNFWGNPHFDSIKETQKSDAEALASDWEAVGNDMKKVLSQINKQTKI